MESPVGSLHYERPQKITASPEQDAWLSWSREEVDGRLKTIMDEIRSECITYGKQPDDSINYIQGQAWLVL